MPKRKTGNTRGLKFAGVFLFFLSTLCLGSEKTLDDGAFIQAMLLSLPGKEIAEQKAILRRVTLFPTSIAVRNEVTIPGLATIMLDADESEELRREAIKAVVNLYGKDRIAVTFVPLLKHEAITLIDTVEAIEKSHAPIFTANLFTAATLPQSPKDLVEPALIAGLKLWECHQCETYFAPLAGSTANDSAQAQLSSIAHAKSAKAVNSEIQIRAYLVLGCLQPGNILPAIMNRFAGESESLRLKIVHFFGIYGGLSDGEQMIAPLIEIFKSDNHYSTCSFG